MNKAPRSRKAVDDRSAGAISKEEALRAEDARYRAMTENDFAAMERLFGEDMIYTHSNALVDNKASFIESLRTGNVRFRTMRRSDVHVRTYGCIGLITGRADFESTVKGQDFSAQLRFTSAWIKRPGGPQFIAWQATRIPAEP